MLVALIRNRLDMDFPADPNTFRYGPERPPAGALKLIFLLFAAGLGPASHADEKSTLNVVASVATATVRPAGNGRRPLNLPFESSRGEFVNR